jgi:hypothetical protein
MTILFGENPMSDDYSAQPHSSAQAQLHERTFTSTFTSTEVANHLNVSPETLQRLSQRFAHYLGEQSAAEDPYFTNADVAALVTVQQLLSQGYADHEIDSLLTPTSMEATAALPPPTSLALAPDRRKGEAEDPTDLPKALGDVLATIATSQQAVLNTQSTVRDMVGVVVQDNFNLKDENRKLRERMLELERVMAEYQRREETRKERAEGRLRALESTVAALQQQVAQLVQLQRQQRKRRGWFG